MKHYIKRFFVLGFSVLSLMSSIAEAGSSLNQTDTITPILPQNFLPFTISIEETSLMLPSGIHSGVCAIHKDKWLFLAGRTNGLHGFGDDPFPPSKQNTTAFVVDLHKNKVYTRELSDPNSGLTQQQIDSLSVASPQYFQNKDTLYISGGYGIDSSNSTFGTKPILTAIDVPELMQWVMHPSSEKKASSSIRQTTSDWMQVTGGFMAGIDSNLNGLLVFGQNFTGYYTPESNGNYTEQVRRFKIIDAETELSVQSKPSESPNSSYRRRDLNVVPVIQNHEQSFIALSGVFTIPGGIWTVPVEISSEGDTFMADPSRWETFKQGMNNYVSANFTLHSSETQDNYIVLLGGITYGFYNGSTFETDSEIPFTKQVTTIRRDKNGNYTQYLMNNQYPLIESTGSNPGNELLFGAGAFFIESDDVPQYSNQVIKYDKIHSPVVVGYIIGGIMSTLPNTNTQSDSAASPYIFKVTLTPH